MAEVEFTKWVEAAATSVEHCIDKLLHAFLKQPFAHRVEHSLHVDLYHLLRSHRILAKDVELGTTGFATRLVHKEWPSHMPFIHRGSRERRQSYDLAVLAPGDLAAGSLSDLVQGRFRAPIAIELGLDYSLNHIQGDIAKLKRNDVPYPYVVHFSRKRTRHATAVEDSVLTDSRVRTAFAHLDVASGTLRWKGIDDAAIRKDRYRP